MSTMIYRAELNLAVTDTIELPAEAIKMMASTYRDGTPIIEIWYRTCAAPYTPKLETFQVFGTGHPLPTYGIWVVSAPRDERGLVWHLVLIPRPGTNGMPDAARVSS